MAGIYSIRDSDRALALAIRGRGFLWHPDKLIVPSFKAWKGLVEAEIKRLRVRVHNGPLADSMRSRGMAWTARDIAINDGPEDWHDWDATRICPLLTHELRHVVEIIYQGADGSFQADYVFRVRLRWAYEMQGVAAEIRWMVAQEARRVNILKRAERAATSFAKPFPGYSMGRIRNLKTETIDTLMSLAA